MKKLRIEIQQELKMNSFEAQHFEHKGRFYKVRTWNHNAFLITDITNAGKRGTTCNELSVNANYDAPDCAIWNELLHDHLTKLFEAATNKALPSELGKENFKFYFREVESKRLLAVELSTIKPLTEEPKKWTLRHVVRALVNGQFEGLRCKYRHLDDTCHDYGKGEITDPVEFVKGIVESPSGWWVSKDNNGIVTVCCHTFDSNEFRPVITPISKRTEKPKAPKVQEEKLEEVKKELSSFDAENLTEEEAKEILKNEGIFIEDTITTPKKAGKKPRPVWQVSGRTNGLEEIFYTLGCSHRRWRGMFSFWEGNPAIDIAKAVLEESRLSFAEQQERKEERAINRTERFEKYADNAQERSNQLYRTNKTLLDCMAGTPILIGHHSEKRHRRDLEKIDNRIRKSIEEDKKAEHYRNRISSISWKLENQKNDPTYINNRIEENEARLRKIERNKKWLSDYESRKQEVIDKLDYFKGILQELMQERAEQGKLIPSPDTIQKGDLVKYRGTWYPVVRVNRKTVTFKNWIWENGQWKASYADITDIKKQMMNEAA